MSGVGAPGPPTPTSSTPDCEASISSVVILAIRVLSPQALEAYRDKKVRYCGLDWRICLDASCLRATRNLDARFHVISILFLIQIRN